jgi:hypothetical protein
LSEFWVDRRDAYELAIGISLSGSLDAVDPN